MSIRLEIRGWKGSGKTTITGVVFKALSEAGYDVQLMGDCDPESITEWPETFIREKIEICEIDTTPEPVRNPEWIKWAVRYFVIYFLLCALVAILVNVTAAVILSIAGAVVGLIVAGIDRREL